MRLDPATSLLGVIDVQERLLPTIPDGSRVVDRCLRLARAAAVLGVRTVLTEQYPQGLGPTPPELAAELPPAVPKRSFSCLGAEAFAAAVTADEPAPVEAVVLAGLETHVCVAQTALDLLALGYPVFLVVDAVAAGHAIDHETAVRRLESSGVIPVTTEAVLFEWCRSADHPRFQEIRRLLVTRHRGPA
jgi:nicotinamidase-related amidase